MKKSRKILIICIVIAAVVAGGAAYTFRPLTFSQAIGGVKAEEILKLELCRDSEKIEISSESEIIEIYDKISSVKWNAVVKENSDGCSFVIFVYIKNSKGCISYGCDKNFYKWDGYKKGVGDFLYYKDSSNTIQGVIKEYFENNKNG